MTKPQKPEKPQPDSALPKLDPPAADSGLPKSTDPGLGPVRSAGAAKLEGRLSEEQWLEALRHFDRHTLPPEVRRQWMLAENPKALSEASPTAPPIESQQQSSETQLALPDNLERTVEAPAATAAPAAPAAGAQSGSGELSTPAAGATSRKSDPAAAVTPGESSSADRSPRFVDTEKRPRDPRLNRPASEPPPHGWSQRLGPLSLAVLGIGAASGIFWSVAQSGGDVEDAIDAPSAVSVSMHAASPSESGHPGSGRSLPLDDAGTSPAAAAPSSVRSSVDLPAEDPVTSQAPSARVRAASPPAQVTKPFARLAPKPPSAPPLPPSSQSAAAAGKTIPCATETLPPCPRSANPRGPRTLGGVDIETPLISD